MTDTKPLLSVKNLSIAFGKRGQLRHVVSALDFDIYPGKCLSLVGESGSGKSLSALAIMQLLPQTASVSQNSEIIFAGNALLHYPERKMRQVRGKDIAMIFQDAMSAFNPVLTIGQQIREVILAHCACNKVQAKQKALSLLDEVGITDSALCYRSYPFELSGGMRQRAMIAMALSAEPKLLIADEPTTSLDVTIQAQILQLLQSLQRKRNMTLLFISHDLAVVSKLADDIVVMQNGHTVEASPASDFFKVPQHEYSRRLLAAIPQPAATEKKITDAATLLRVNDLKVYFPIRSPVLHRTIDYVKAVDGVSFDLCSGETLALVGESGSGKTTTGKAIIQLLQNSGGDIEFQGLCSDMQIIFQDPNSSLNPRMLVVDIVAEGLIAQKKVSSRQQAIADVDELLQQVGLPLDSKWRYPHEFSGGQRQRICIARAIALKPKLLVLDEPTSALDVSIQMQVLNLLKSLQNQLSLSYLLITHNLSVVAYMAQQVAVMYHGKIVEQGDTETVLNRPQHRYTQRLLSAVPNITTDNTQGQHHD